MLHVVLLRSILAPALLVVTVVAGLLIVPVPSRARVDYNIFLVTRAREEAARLGTRQGC